MSTFRTILAMWALSEFAFCGLMPAQAQAPALSFSTDGGFTSGFTGTLGWEFTVNNTATLTAFGFYNNGGTITTSHQIGLWDTSGNLLTSGMVGPSAADTTAGYFDYSSTTSYLLQAGHNYVIGTLLNASDFFYYDPSTITTDPSISYVQTQYDMNRTAVLAFPQTTDFPANGYGYFGPNFKIGGTSPPAVPEPQGPLVSALATLSTLGLCLPKRRQSN